MHRLSAHEVKSFDELYETLAPDALLHGGASRHTVFRDYRTSPTPTASTRPSPWPGGVTASWSSSLSGLGPAGNGRRLPRHIFAPS